MGGADKGAVMVAGRRLIDHVIEKLKPQIDRIIISGAHDYGTGLTHLPDRKDGPAGPAAGLWSALMWIVRHAPNSNGFLTAPVDGPFQPPGLFEKLYTAQSSAVVRDDAGLHPTFGWWRLADLQSAFQSMRPGDAPSLKSIAKKITAREIIFPGEQSFTNLNTPEEIAEAEAILPQHGVS